MIAPQRYRVEQRPAARRFLRELRGDVQDRILEALRELADDPTPPDSRPMKGKGEGMHRLRVDDYRIVYRLTDQPPKVRIVRIGHRDNVYEGYEP